MGGRSCRRLLLLLLVMTLLLAVKPLLVRGRQLANEYVSASGF